MSYHKIILVGRLGNDPELRYTSSGKAVCNLSVATSNKFTSADGVKHDETTWWKCAVWGKQAESCHQYLAKGRQVLVEGRMTGTRIAAQSGTQVVPTVWVNKAGVSCASFELTANTVRFLGSKGENGGAPAASGDLGGQNEAAASEEDYADIPF